MMRLNVLILSAGRRVELVNRFQRARKRLGIEGEVFAADVVNTAPALYFADRFFMIPRIKDASYIDGLINACNFNDIHMIVPTIDTELEILSIRKREIEARSHAKVMVSDYETTRACCNKILTEKLLLQKGFSVPKAITKDMIDRGEYEFPLFIKPSDGSSSINAFRIRSQRELDFFKDYVPNPIIQQCICGAEYTVDCFCDFDGNAITIVPRIRIATRGGEILKGKIDKNPHVISTVKALLRAIKFIGHITIQGFLLEDNTFSIVEINPRFGGGAPMSIDAGADSCENLYRLMRGEKLAYNENYEDGVVFSRFDNSIRVPQ